MKAVFAKRLSRLRHEAEWSQRRAASDLNVSQALLSHYENGAREPKLEFVVKACNYYGVSADYILGRSEDKAKDARHAPHCCEEATRLLSAIGAVLETLDALSDKELCAAIVNYLMIPVSIVAQLLSEPDTQYDPVRDAELKMAEAAFTARVRGILPA